MSDYMNNQQVLFTESEIKKRVEELAKIINNDYKDEHVVLVCILKGSYIFTADLSRNLDISCQIEFMQVSSYGDSTETSGSLRIIKDLNIPVDGKHLLIIEDIIDTGLTLKNLKAMLQTRNPASVKIAAFLDKPSRRKVDIEADYVGFEIDDLFVVGYGLDFSQKYRNLPHIAILNE